MTGFLFPDNTVLCDFAAVGRLDLLRSVLDGALRPFQGITTRKTIDLVSLAVINGDIGALAETVINLPYVRSQFRSQASARPIRNSAQS